MDSTDQVVVAAAAGPSGYALAWQQGDEVIVSVSAEGGAKEAIAYPLGLVSNVTIAISPAGRTHLAYNRDGIIVYRYSDDTHIAKVTEETVLPAGEHPTLVVDNQGWPHLFFLSGGLVFYMERTVRGWSEPMTVGYGDTVSAAVNSNGNLLATVRDGASVRVFHRSQTGDTWSERASYPTSTVIGTPHLDAVGEWVYLAWVTEQLDPTGNDWPRRRPEYKEAFPFVNRIFSGENAQQYFTTYGIHDAGVYQTFSTSPGMALVASAQYMGWSCDLPSICTSALPNEPNPPSGSGANMRAQICLDPTGGVDIYSPSVVCSGASNVLDAWVTLSISAIAQAGQATIFLRSQPDMPRQIQDVYWDHVELSGGSLVNPDFEGTFAQWNGIQELKVADGWTPFYVEDPPEASATGRYEIHTAWSDDGGATWGGDVLVATNSTSGQERSGAFGPHVYPMISPEQQYTAFTFLYMDGDPLQEGVKRFGRPVLAACVLGEETCAGFWRILPNSVSRPVSHLVADVGPGRFLVVAWDAYQSSRGLNRDVFATVLAP